MAAKGGPPPCESGKQQHAEKSGAIRQLDSLRHSRRRAAGRTSIYHCNKCGCWHVGRR